MIEESYVSFETAKLLKEAGFDEVCRYAYYSTWDKAVMHERNNMLSPGYISCPTQALAARWLREVHRIVVDANFIPPSTDGNAWIYFIGEMDDMVWSGDYVPSDEFYEAALEAGLQEAIKLIKK